MGLTLHPLFTLPAGFALMALLPVLARAKPQALLISSAASLALALVLAVVAGLQPAYSAASPLPLNLTYVESGSKAWWIAEPVARLPDALRAAANFSARPERHVAFGYAAAANSARLAAPRASVTRNGDTVSLDVHSDGDIFELVLPKDADVKAVAVNGVDVAPPGDHFLLICGAGCRDARVALTLGNMDAQTLRLISVWRGLPPLGAKLARARPDWVTPIREGDQSLAVTDVAIPAR